MHEKKYLVKDYMSKRGVTVSATATLRDAVTLMLKEKTNGAVVIDEKHKVIGILSSWDIITQIVPDYLESDDNLMVFEAERVFVDRVHTTANVLVKDFMTTNVHVVKETHSLVEAAALLAEHGIRQLPVTNEQGEMIGYINRTDIKRAIGDVLGIHSES